MPEGEIAPPMPLNGVVALTEPDAAGRIFMVVQFSDNTMTAQFRLPWQTAAQFGQQLAQQMAEQAARAQAMSGPQLVVPGVNAPPGIPTDLRPPFPPPNGRKRS